MPVSSLMWLFWFKFFLLTKQFNRTFVFTKQRNFDIWWKLHDADLEKVCYLLTEYDEIVIYY